MLSAPSSEKKARSVDESSISTLHPNQMQMRITSHNDFNYMLPDTYRELDCEFIFKYGQRSHS